PPHARADALGESKLLLPVHAAPATPVSGAAAYALGPRQTLPDDFAPARPESFVLPAPASHRRPIAAPPRSRTPRQTDPAACASHAAYAPATDTDPSAIGARCARSCRLPRPPPLASCLPSAFSATP